MTLRAIYFALIGSMMTSFSGVNAQDKVEYSPNIEITKNHIYGMLGSSLRVMAMSAVYERDLTNLHGGSLNARVGAGLYAFWFGDEGTQYFSTIGFVSAAEKKHHFEGCLGLAALIDSYAYEHREDPNPDYPDSYLSWLPAVYAGYRYKKPNGKFIFRAGLGWPETFGVSFGTSF